MVACALVVFGLAGWWFGVELPERRAVAELRRQQAEKSFRIADLGLDMVWIPPGTFRMGTPEQNFLARWFYDAREKLTNNPNPSHRISPNDERPVTWVTLTQPFWLGRTEVTQAQWQAVMRNNPSDPARGGDLPVDHVSWDDAVEFCGKLTVREHAAGRLPTGYVYTLPTEAQWEYACRAGTTGDYAGDLDAMGWYDPNRGGTRSPVGMKQANTWGLADMHGSVWEWCMDWFGDYPGSSVTNPSGPASGSARNARVARGGSRVSNPEHCRSAYRSAMWPGNRFDDLGFRLALAPAPQAPASPAVSAR
jgi:formylglycine-generating enzyme required for sulfatase activity